MGRTVPKPIIDDLDYIVRHGDMKGHTIRDLVEREQWFLLNHKGRIDHCQVSERLMAMAEKNNDYQYDEMQNRLP